VLSLRRLILDRLESSKQMKDAALRPLGSGTEGFGKHLDGINQW
jgi:hypothetical protein